MVGKRLLLLVAVCILAITLVQAAPTVTYVDPTNQDSASITDTNVEVNVSIVELNLDEVIYNWNGNNFTMYDDSLILMYNLDNVSDLGEDDTSILDLSTNENNATVTNALVNTTDCKYLNCFSFDGSGDKIDVDNSGNIHLSTITVSAWIKPLEPGAGLRWEGDTIVTKYDIDDLVFGWRLVYDSNNKASFVYLTVGCETDWATGTSNLNDGNWHHVLGVRDTNELKIYVDGVLEGTDSSISCATESNSAPIRIGYRRDGALANPNEDFKGNIDDVIIWNRTLSDDEVYQLYVSNLQKVNSTTWNLYVNQEKNATDGLDLGTYNYEVFGIDNLASVGTSGLRTIIIQVASVPEFSDYAIAFLLMTVAGGFFYMRRQD